MASAAAGADAESGAATHAPSLSRRRFLAWSALAVAAGLLRFPADAQASVAGRVRPLPLASVRLRPSMFLDSLQTNRGYLLRLQADRLLHNFRLYAGLEPKAPVYGGWEADTIAGHTLGHYLSALALLHAQTGDGACLRRANYIVAELAQCQQRAGDGYVAGFTRKNDAGQIESGRAVFDEVARGDIRPLPFYLNGSWAPLYTWHKLFAGLLDVHQHCAQPQALQVALGLGGYLDAVFARLSDAQLQQVLSCEFGGLNESFVELHARTGEERWLWLARRLHHHAVIDPLVAQRDELAHQHSNTNIPKLIGLAREFEVGGDPAAAAASRFFWETVVAHHTYSIGGNGDREYFQQPDSISRFITEQTCEHCASYNMLKLTRHLYQWTPQARYFDYYERTLLNHVMAQQHPRTGMFTYMTPLLACEARAYSKPFDDFWCCVGTGMEAHAQFGDSIYWHDDESLYVNLYIASSAACDALGLGVQLDTTLPLQGQATLTLTRASDPRERTIALRIPGWADGFGVRVNGAPVAADAEQGYVRLRRSWRPGDTVQLTLPMALRLEPTGDDPQLVSVLHGPLVLGADLGAADAPWDGREPALVADGALLQAFRALPQPGEYVFSGADGSAPLRLAPFHGLHDRRSAVYFASADPAAWQRLQQQRAQAAAAEQAWQAQALDAVALGDAASEKAHGLRSDQSYDLSYRRRKGRDARTGGFIEFDLRNAAQAQVLRLRYWGDETRRRFRILADGERVADERLDGNRGLDFVDVDYPLPPSLAGRDTLRVRIEPEKGYSAGPAFGCWLLRAG
ncbi:glycoside hydrolase family 127 protein [Xanthomonas sp. AmX2]|uniref:glycoside hydrolase family 127 protein n=1 Tax=Xanthomonas sp. TaxID=29446 RepID=UPI0019826F71|nr:glycoside hydrolase family 127 protein [Xanthomonas sp.]MBN6149739.1 glycoside hydrolase family 127 protein [Xanthomonas sp.]